MLRTTRAPSSSSVGTSSTGSSTRCGSSSNRSSSWRPLVSHPACVDYYVCASTQEPPTASQRAFQYLDRALKLPIRSGSFVMVRSAMPSLLSARTQGYAVTCTRSRAVGCAVQARRLAPWTPLPQSSISSTWPPLHITPLTTRSLSSLPDCARIARDGALYSASTRRRPVLHQR